MKKFFLCLIILFFLFISEIKARDFELGLYVCDTEACESGSNPDNDDKFMIPSGKKLYINVDWSTLFNDDLDLHHIDITYSASSGITRTNNYKMTNSVYSVSTINNGFRVTRVGNLADDPFGNIAAEFTLPANTGTSYSNFYNVETTAVAYNSSSQSIANIKVKIKVSVLGSNKPNYDNDATLTGIDLSSGTLSPAYDNNVMFYSINTNEPTITINLKTRSSKATIYYGGRAVNEQDVEDFMQNPKKISGPQTYPVEYGTNVLMFSVLSEKYEHQEDAVDGATYLYNSWPRNDDADGRLIELVIIRQDTRSTVNTLKSLSISDVAIDFKPDLKFYNATVKNEVESVSISSSLTDSKSKYVNGFGNRTEHLKEGTNTFYVKVQAENGAEGVYTITIEREKSANNKLKEISVNGKIIAIKEDTFKYELNVDNEVTTAEVIATPELEEAVVEIGEIPPLVEGNNEVNITVTAPNGEKKIYVVNIKRDSLVSSNSLLKKLEVKGYDLDFNIHTREYTLKINDEQELDITAEADHKKAKVLITGNKDLVNGSVIKIKVTAEDGSESTYEIKIEKESKKFNPLLLIPIIGILLLISSIVFAVIANNKKKKKIVATPLGDLKILSTEEETPSIPAEPATPAEPAPVEEATPIEESPAPVEAPVETTTGSEQAPALSTAPIETPNEPAPVEPVQEETAPVEAPAAQVTEEVPAEVASIYQTKAPEESAPVEAPAPDAPTAEKVEPFKPIEAVEPTPPDPVGASENVEILNLESNSNATESTNPEIKQN